MTPNKFAFIRFFSKLKGVPLREIATLASRYWDDDFDPLFICGVAGSGTTLLSGLLDQRYKNAGCLHESALMMPVKSVLKMQSVTSYGSLSAYYQGMFIPGSVPNSEIRASALGVYRRIALYPKQSTVVIDKAPNVHLVRASRLKGAFPSAKILLIFRDPVSTIEGLRRKWPDVFGRADIEEICNFWQSVHEVFLTDIQDFLSDVLAVSYERLTQDTDGVLRSLAELCGLEPREHIRKYPAKGNLPGKGLRNVIDGEIKIARETIPSHMWCLSEHERVHIRKELMALFETLNTLHKGRLS